MIEEAAEEDAPDELRIVHRPRNAPGWGPPPGQGTARIGGGETNRIRLSHMADGHIMMALLAYTQPAPTRLSTRLPFFA